MVLVVPFVLEIVTAVGLTGYLSFRNGQQAIKNLAFQLVEHVGDRSSSYLQEIMEKPHLINQMNEDLLQSGAMSVLETSNPAQIENYLWRQIQRFPMVSSISVGNQRGGAVGIAQTESDRFRVFRTERFARGTYSVSELDSRGKTLKREVISPKYDARLQPWFQQSVQAGQSEWSRVYQTTGKSPGLAISASLPVFDRNGNVQAVLKTDLRLKQVDEFLQSVTPTQNGVVLLVERSGLMLASSAKEPLFRHRKQRFERLKATSSSHDSISAAAASMGAQLGGFDRIQKPEQFDYTQSGKRYFVHAAPFRDRRGLDWVIVVAVPESDFMQELAANQRLTIWLSTGALAVAIALGLLTSSLIAKPILRLSRASRDLALGKLEDEIKPDSPIAELEMLGRFFNEMTGHLQESFDQVKIALQESEEKFTKVFRTSPDPIAISTLREGRYLEINDSFLAWLGRPREEVVGLTGLELGLWASAQERAIFIQELRSNGRISEQEFHLCRDDSEFKTLLVSSELVELDGQTCILSVGKDITERKRLELALQKSEAKLKTVLTSAITAVACFRLYPDNTLEYEFLSPSHEAIFGFTEAEFKANDRLWRSRVHEEDFPHSFALIPTTATQPGSFVSEYRFRRKDGQWIWISDHTTYRWNAEDACCVVTAVGIDISDRKQAEEALRQSEQRFRGAFDTAAVGINLCSIDGQFLQTNPAFCQMVGFTEAELQTMKFQDVTHPEDLVADLVLCQRMLTGEIPGYTLEKRYLHKSGRTVWTILSVSMVNDVEGSPLYIVGHVQNITIRKQAEQALQQSTTRYLGILEDQTVMIALFLPSGVLTFVNEAFCNYFGLERQSAIGYPLDHLVFWEDRERLAKLSHDVNQENPIVTMKIRVMVQGEVRWTQWTNRAIFDDNKQIIEYQAVGREIDNLRRVIASLEVKETHTTSFPV